MKCIIIGVATLGWFVNKEKKIINESIESFPEKMKCIIIGVATLGWFVNKEKKIINESIEKRVLL